MADSMSGGHTYATRKFRGIPRRPALRPSQGNPFFPVLAYGRQVGIFRGKGRRLGTRNPWGETSIGWNFSTTSCVQGRGSHKIWDGGLFSSAGLQSRGEPLFSCCQHRCTSREEMWNTRKRTGIRKRKGFFRKNLKKEKGPTARFEDDPARKCCITGRGRGKLRGKPLLQKPGRSVGGVRGSPPQSGKEGNAGRTVTEKNGPEPKGFLLETSASQGKKTKRRCTGKGRKEWTS